MHAPSMTLVLHVDSRARVPRSQPACALEQDQVVAMHDFTLEGRSELPGQVVGAAAQQPRQLGGIVVDQSSGDRATRRVAQIHRITVSESSLDAEDAGRE